MTNIPDKLIQFFFNRFINRPDVYNRQWANEVDYGYKTMHQMVTKDLLEAHLSGQVTLAIFALSEESTCQWGCWDSDKQNGKLHRLYSELLACGWRILREGARPGRDGHLWLFFDEPILAVDLRRFAASFQKAAGIADNEIEFFPKQDKAILGSSVRLPLGIHKKPGAGDRGWFEDAPKNVIAQLEWFAAQPVNQAKALKQLSEELRRQALVNKSIFKPPGKLTYDNKKIIEAKFLPSQNILHLISNPRRRGDGFVAQCPLCAAEGHDLHRDNLHITLDGSNFCCWFNGQPGKIHTKHDIIAALSTIKKKGWG